MEMGQHLTCVSQVPPMVYRKGELTRAQWRRSVGKLERRR
jgi:hypothetical protein